MSAFDCIFLRHNDRPAITETNVFWLKPEMVWKCVRFQLQTSLLQRAKKSLGMTNTGHGVYCLRAEIMQRTDLVGIQQVMRISLLHSQRVFLLAPQAIIDHQVNSL